jgi:GT2 family glycosyltransferase
MHDRSQLISICIPTFRRPSLLLHALHSCFLQDFRPLEIEIGDDSPNSETEDLVATLASPDGIDLHYRRNRPGLGQAGNVNALFHRAKGQRLVLLHDDDLLMPHAITALNETFALSHSVIASYGIQDVVSEHGELDEAETRTNNEHCNRLPAHAGIQSNPVTCALWRQFPNDGYLIDSNIARSTGYRDNEIVGNANDTDFAIRVALQNRGSSFYFLNRLTSRYRLSSASIRTQHDTCRKLYHIIEHLELGNESEQNARDWLLDKIAEEAVVDHALHGEWKVALGIMRSAHYPAFRRPIKSIFHLAITAIPSLYSLRSMAGGADEPTRLADARPKFR